MLEVVHFVAVRAQELDRGGLLGIAPACREINFGHGLRPPENRAQLTDD
jgi:hypothetical protein